MDTQIIEQLRNGSLGSKAELKDSLTETLAGCPEGQTRLIFTYMGRDSEGSAVLPSGELITTEGRFIFYTRLAEQIDKLMTHWVSDSVELA